MFRHLCRQVDVCEFLWIVRFDFILVVEILKAWPKDSLLEKQYIALPGKPRRTLRPVRKSRDIWLEILASHMGAKSQADSPNGICSMCRHISKFRARTHKGVPSSTRLENSLCSCSCCRLAAVCRPPLTVPCVCVWARVCVCVCVCVGRWVVRVRVWV